MRFGQCAECSNYRYLAQGQLCYTHSTARKVQLDITTSGVGITPDILHALSSSIRKEPLLVNSGGDTEWRFVFAELELLIIDNSGDTVGAFEYDSYGSKKPTVALVDDAVEWTVQHAMS